MNYYKVRVKLSGIDKTCVMYPSASNEEEAEKLVREHISRNNPDLVVDKISIKPITYRGVIRGCGGM